MTTRTVPPVVPGSRLRYRMDTSWVSRAPHVIVYSTVCSEGYYLRDGDTVLVVSDVQFLGATQRRDDKIAFYALMDDGYVRWSSWYISEIQFL